MDLKMNTKDFAHHFNGCVGIITHPKLASKDKQFLFAFSGFDSKSTPHDYMVGAVAEANDSDASSWEPFGFLWAEPEAEVKFSWPELGLINFNKGVIKVTRVPKHHWKKGYHRNSLHVWNINYMEQSILKRKNVMNDDLNKPRLIKELYQPKYIAPMDAYHSVLEGDRLGAAINRKFFTKITFDSDEIYLGYKKNVVGVLRKNTQEPLRVDLFRGNEFLIEQVSELFTVGRIIDAAS